MGDALPQLRAAPAHGGGELGELAGGLAVMAAVDFSGAVFGVGETQARSWRFPARPVRRCGFRGARPGSR